MNTNTVTVGTNAEVDLARIGVLCVCVVVKVGEVGGGEVGQEREKVCVCPCVRTYLSIHPSLPPSTCA